MPARAPSVNRWCRRFRSPPSEGRICFDLKIRIRGIVTANYTVNDSVCISLGCYQPVIIHILPTANHTIKNGIDDIILRGNFFLAAEKDQAKQEGNDDTHSVLFIPDTGLSQSAACGEY